MTSLYFVYDESEFPDPAVLKSVFFTKDAVDTFMKSQTWIHGWRGRLEHPFVAYEVTIDEDGGVLTKEELDYSSYAPKEDTGISKSYGIVYSTHT